MKKIIKNIAQSMNKVPDKSKNLSLVLLRFVLAYGFYGPAMMKWNDIHAIGDWFKSMSYPFPYLNAYMAGITEVLGVILLVLGLGTRYISVALIFVMFIAISTVHLKNGFEAGSNGFEIPLYYAVMLFALFAYGSGKFSIDGILCKNKS